MGPITATVVHNLSREKEQLILKLNNKIMFRNLCKYWWSAIYRSCQSDFTYTYTLRDGANPSSKRRLHAKVKMANYLWDQARKQHLFNFSHTYATDLGSIFIITPSYTSLVTKRDWGASLLGLTKSIYYWLHKTHQWALLFIDNRHFMGFLHKQNQT